MRQEPSILQRESFLARKSDVISHEKRTAPERLPVPTLAGPHRTVIGHGSSGGRRARHDLPAKLLPHDGRQEGSIEWYMHLSMCVLLETERVCALLLGRHSALQLPLETLRVESSEESKAVA